MHCGATGKNQPRFRIDITMKWLAFADFYRTGCGFESRTTHNKYAVGEEGNGKPPRCNPLTWNNMRALSLGLLLMKSSYFVVSLRLYVTHTETPIKTYL